MSQGFDVHTIRLQGPWRLQKVASPAVTEQADFEEIRVPCSWEQCLGDYAGSARFLRKFNSPTGLKQGDEVYVVLPDECGDVESLRLNGELISPRDSGYLITKQLQLHNNLEIQLHFVPNEDSADIGGLWQPVVLKIHSVWEETL